MIDFFGASSINFAPEARSYRGVLLLSKSVNSICVAGLSPHSPIPTPNYFWTWAASGHIVFNGSLCLKFAPLTIQEALLLFCPLCVCVRVDHVSHVWLFVTPWTIDHQAPLSMRFSRQEQLEWVAIPFSSP